MLVGYARVSTEDQRLDLQLDALERAGVGRVLTDVGSGATMKNRPGLDMAMSLLRPGDSLVVWKLDRLARSMLELATVSKTLEAKGIQLRSLQENIDTSTATGSLMFGIFAVMAEFERNLLIERTKAGLEAARKRGSLVGRKKELSQKQSDQMIEMIRSTNLPLEKIASTFRISKTAIYNYCPGGRSGLQERDLEEAKLLAAVED